jgi:O-antigen ligase
MSAQKIVNFQFALIAFVFIAAIPLGSNRPFFWAINLSIISTFGFLYLLTDTFSRSGSARSPIWPKPTIIAYFAFMVFVLLQCFPLPLLTLSGDLIPASIVPQRISVAVGTTFLSFMRWLTYGLLFWLTIKLFWKTGRAQLCLQVVAIAIALFSLYSLIALTQLGDPLLIFEKKSYLGVATGTFVNRNSFATFLAIGIVISGSFALAELQSIIRHANAWLKMGSSTLLLNIACFAVILIGLITTESRMGLFAAGLGLFTTIVLWLPKIERFRLILSLSFLFASMAAAALILLNADTFLDRVLTTGLAAGTRFDAYLLTLKLIIDRPLTGFGAGTFELVFPLVRDYSLSPYYVWDKAHSTYLSLFVEFGVIFGLLPIIMVAFLFKNALVQYSQSSRVSVRNLSTIAVIVVVAVHSLVDFSLEIQAVALLFVFILGLGSTVRKKNVA